MPVGTDAEAGDARLYHAPPDTGDHRETAGPRPDVVLRGPQPARHDGSKFIAMPLMQ
jgi:hypothetical protein